MHLFCIARASRSRTTSVWVVNLVKPMLIMMQFVRAEWEGDWPLHLSAVAAMMPYFFASSHFNYARLVLSNVTSNICFQARTKYLLSYHLPV